MAAKRFIVTGGAGFIGSALVRSILRETDASVLVVDKLTYAGNLESLKEAGVSPWAAPDYECDKPDPMPARCQFFQADICDIGAMTAAFEVYCPDAVFHLAAESHVDRSIDGPGEFIRTNVTGTAVLLQAALSYWRNLPEDGDGPTKKSFRFQHISTDLSEKRVSLRRRLHTRPIPRIPPPRPLRIILYALGTIPMVFRFSSRTAPTTMVHTISRKSSFRSSY